MTITKDWPSGNYQNKCRLCSALFMGPKRQTVCKVCAAFPQKVEIMTPAIAPDEFSTRFETEAYCRGWNDAMAAAKEK